MEKKDLQSHLDQAARSCRLTETLMNHIEELSLVPIDLMTQLRHNNELYLCRLKENNNPVSIYCDNKLNVFDCVVCQSHLKCFLFSHVTVLRLLQ